MYPYISPATLYEEYQARVDGAGRKHTWEAEALQVSRRQPGTRVRYRAWWSATRRRLERHLQPAEEGYIA